MGSSGLPAVIEYNYCHHNNTFILHYFTINNNEN